MEKSSTAVAGTPLLPPPRAAQSSPERLATLRGGVSLWGAKW